MALEGFRLHILGVREGLYGRTVLRFGEGELKDPLGDLVESLSRAKNQQLSARATLRGDPTKIENLKPNDPIFRIDDFRRIGTRALGVELSYGNIGAFETAMDPANGTDVDMRRMAPSRKHSVVFFMPTAGEDAAMAATSRGRTSLGPMMLKALAALDGQTTPDPSSVKKWLTRVLFDESRVEQIVSDGELRGIVLKAHSRNRGGTPDTRTVNISQNGLLGSDKREASSLIKAWLKAYANKKTETDTRDLTALVEMLAIDVQENEDTSFTDGKFTFQLDGRQQTIGPKNLDQILTYPMSGNVANMDDLHNASANRLAVIQNAIGVPLGL